ncbi:hypothetical protein BKM09_004825 [Pseudomonas amygdali pv. morsprunorum]|nr:hypothetical protein BKM09_004825 [Pseudomonas amygdali pv. morsprunorum]
MPDTAQKRTRASHYRATFRAGMPLRTLTIVRRSASHAVLDALRPLERRVQGHQGHDRAVF